MLRPKSLDFGRYICSKGPRRHTVGEVGRLTDTHETTIPMKAVNTKSSSTYLTQPLRRLPQSAGHSARFVLDGCDASLSRRDTVPALSLTAATAEISPPALRALPFTPGTAADTMVATAGGTTTSCPSPDPATYH
jgi:hypothetical protein